MKNMIMAVLTGLFLSASMSAAAMDYCAQSSKPDVCYGAQVRTLNQVRKERNQKVRTTTIVNNSWKQQWFNNERNFERWVDSNCRNSACVKENLETHNNRSWYLLSTKGIIK